MRKLLLLLLSSVLAARALPAQSSADTAGAMATVREFVRANELADLDRIVRTFDEAATVFMPVGNAPYRLTGTAQIRAAFADVFKGRTGPITITPSAVEAQVVGDVVIVTAHLRAIPPTPITEPLSFARRTFVLRQVGGEWRIVHHHASNFQWKPPGA